MSSYIKPQNPLYNEAADVYIYPLTTVDQIVLSNGERLNESCFGKGIELNYSIIGGLEEPENPTENMIWVQTDEEITKHRFSKDEPKNPIEGMVWVFTGENSNVSFHTLNINEKEFDEIYPISAKQYVDDAWVDKTAKSYQNGQWADWWDGTLFDNGNEYKDITGGWTANGFSVENLVLVPGGFVKADGRLKFNPASSNGNDVSIGGCANPIDLTPFKEILVTYENKILTSGQGVCFSISTGKDVKTTRVAVTSFTGAVNTIKTDSFPVDTISGKHYITAYGFNTQRGEILSVKLVR